MDDAHLSKLLAQCPMCQATYLKDDLRLLGEKGATRLFHCTCRACGHAMLAMVLEAHGSVSSVGLMTDLEAPDALRFRDLEPVSADECIAMHRFLQTESLDLCASLLTSQAGVDNVG